MLAIPQSGRGSPTQREGKEQGAEPKEAVPIHGCVK